MLPSRVSIYRFNFYSDCIAFETLYALHFKNYNFLSKVIMIKKNKWGVAGETSGDKNVGEQ